MNFVVLGAPSANYSGESVCMCGFEKHFFEKKVHSDSDLHYEFIVDLFLMHLPYYESFNSS